MTCGGEEFGERHSAKTSFICDELLPRHSLLLVKGVHFVLDTSTELSW